MQYFINFLIEIQNKILNKKTSRHANTLGFGVSLNLTSKIEAKKTKLEKDVNAILKSCNNNPEKLIVYLKSQGVKVYRFDFAKNILGAISQEIGFVPETKGLKALLLNLILACNTDKDFELSFQTENMFVLDSKSCDSFWFIQQFYKWYGMKLNLPGYDAKTQECFNSFLCSSSDEKIKSLSIDEILDLKEAIARDVEAINFVTELAKSTVGSKSASLKISNGGAVV